MSSSINFTVFNEIKLVFRQKWNVFLKEELNLMLFD